jgi:hypothetical protein
MNYTSLLLLALSTPLISLATSPGPGDAQCGLLNKIGTMAAEDSTRSAALSVLEQIAKAGNQNISADLERRLGLTAGDLHHPAYSDTGFACALCVVLAEPAFPRRPISYGTSTFRTLPETNPIDSGRQHRLLCERLSSAASQTRS